MSRKDEPIPGHKVEKRRKRRWDRKDETFVDWKYGEFSFPAFEVPHITFRERKKKKKR